MSATAESLTGYQSPDQHTLEAHDGREPVLLRVMNIQRAADDWLGELERKGHSPRTVETYRRFLYELADAYPQTDVHTVDRKMLRRFLDTQARRKDGGHKSDSTVAQNVSIINGFFDWMAKEDGYLDPRRGNPTRANGLRVLGRPKVGRPEENDNVVTISTSDVAKLKKAADESGEWNKRLAIYGLIYLGPRRRALAQARLRDYDPETRTMQFLEKGGKYIRKPVPDRFADLVDAALADGTVWNSRDDYLVPGNGDQRRRGERDDRIVWRLVRSVAEAAGVTTHVHALRAAFAVHFLEQKPDQLLALRDLMGHRRVETTLVYLRRLDRQRSMETVRDLDWETV